MAEVLNDLILPLLSHLLTSLLHLGPVFYYPLAYSQHCGVLVSHFRFISLPLPRHYKVILVLNF